ncbi:MAG: hypothetical protein AAF654_12335 [Myxococcota bacterium]
MKSGISAAESPASIIPLTALFVANSTPPVAAAGTSIPVELTKKTKSTPAVSSGIAMFRGPPATVTVAGVLLRRGMLLSGWAA